MERIKSLISMAVSAHGLAAEARRHFEIDPDTFGFIDTAYWLCADLRDEIGRAVEWYDTMQGDCNDLVTIARANSHTIRRS